VKLLRLLAVVVFVLAAPVAALADEEAHEGAGESHHAAAGEGEGEGEHGGAHEAPSLDLAKLGWQFLNFGILVFILIKFGGPPVTKALQARHDQIKTDLASAAEARAAAQARFEQQEKRLLALEHEIADIARNIKQEAEAEKVRLIAIAEERAQRIREESEFIIEQQVKQAEEDLRREVAAAAVALAEKIVRSQIVAGDQQRLIDTFVGDVASANGTHPPGTPPSGSGGPAARGAPRSEI
jgi:F-type H+-transporting ATPase subunit b